MSSSHNNLQQSRVSGSAGPIAGEASRSRSIATRVTDAEFTEIEAAASSAGKKVAEWLRDAALASIRNPREYETDEILLAEIMGMRSLMLNLFAQASKGPLSSEDMRKMSVYADSIKDQKAFENLAQRRLKNAEK